MNERIVEWFGSWWFWWVWAAVGTMVAVTLGQWSMMQTVVLVALALAGSWPPSRPAAWFAAPVIGWLVGYRWMGIWSEWGHKHVSIEPVAEMDAWLTGWFVSHGDTLQATLVSLQSVWLDLAGALLYLTHTIGIFGYVLWRLYRSNRTPEASLTARDFCFTWGFLLLNVLAFSVWIIWPVAPPWYLESFGPAPPDGTIQGDPAGIARVDAWLGVQMFASIYGSNEYVFGAMPSLHVGYPMWFVLFLRHPAARFIGALYVLAMAFFAVYFNHHYVVDVLAGMTLAVGCRWLAWRAQVWLERHPAALDGMSGQS